MVLVLGILAILAVPAIGGVALLIGWRAIDETSRKSGKPRQFKRELFCVNCGNHYRDSFAMGTNTNGHPSQCRHCKIHGVVSGHWLEPDGQGRTNHASD